MEPADLFHRLGGMERASKIVLAMYDRVLASERLEPYFRDVDMRRLVEHQAQFLASVMGGPESHTDEDLRIIHSRLEIDRATFREMLDQLRAAMEVEGVAERDVDFVLAAYARRESCIVTRRSGSRVR